MPTIQVRDVPAELHSRLVMMAKEQGRSLNKQVLMILEEAVHHQDDYKQRRRKVLQRIARRRPVTVKTAPVNVIRELRDK